MRKIITRPELLPLQIQEGLSDYRRRQSFEKEILEFDSYVKFGDEKILNKYDIVLKFHIWFIHINVSVWGQFYKKFKYCIFDNELKYDNLINMLIMVKDAGDGFRDILLKNLPYFDRWTILDTGSSDNTVAIINEVLSGKKGCLYEEPFINFRDSRNRLLELAGEQCMFNIMLDDTYYLNGELRNFLNDARGDDVVSSYSISIKNSDSLYISNRITKSSLGLKYVNLVHEIIQSENNFNACIPYDIAYITDISSCYMQSRTLQRKQKDIDILKQMLIDEPDNPRTLFYLADSYILLEDYVNAIKYFKLRVLHKTPGFNCEIRESLYFIAVISDIFLKLDWSVCHQLYLDCYNFDTTRSEALYFIGNHYVINNNKEIAYMYLLQAYNLGIPEINMNFRCDIYYYYIPYTLIKLCYEFKNFSLGEECCRKILNYKEDQLVKKWLDIFYLCNQTLKVQKKELVEYDEKVICFISPGGWNQWDGETLYRLGLGGSENFSIKYAEELVKMGYKVIVLCDCEYSKIFNGVEYIQINNFSNIIINYNIHTFIINRIPSYIHSVVLYNTTAKNIYYVLHDLEESNTILPISDKLTNILCISEWHKQQFIQIFPNFENITKVISYGIDIENFPLNKKEKYSFIYPSFPNRGLLQLLQIFPKIVAKYEIAKLNIFCDFENKWLVDNYQDDIIQIKILLEQQKKYVINHGWVNRSTLRDYWSKSHIWFYPCTFKETCCLTAYEAAVSKTLVVSNHLAALKESIGNRGVIIDGNPVEQEWQDKALKILFEILDNDGEKEFVDLNYDWVQTKHFSIIVSDFRKKYIK